jgi:hypothetical protein
MLYTRFIACGDSFTEGMSDEIVDGQYRGWADRMADVMAHQSPEFTYANFAVRGKLIHQVAADQVPVALTYVTGRLSSHFMPVPTMFCVQTTNQKPHSLSTQRRFARSQHREPLSFYLPFWSERIEKERLPICGPRDFLNLIRM